jgi:uncharacterized protein with HEPN domain
MKRDISLYLKDVFEHMKHAEAFIENLTYEEFIKDKKTSYAVVRCIEIIGEAVKNIHDNVREKYSDIPWKKMAGMRDKISHFYFGVNLERVWQTVKEDIPKIEPSIKKILKDIKSEKPQRKQAVKKENA